jgi:hypothetical protein
MAKSKIIKTEEAVITETTVTKKPAKKRVSKKTKTSKKVEESVSENIQVNDIVDSNSNSNLISNSSKVDMDLDKPVPTTKLNFIGDDIISSEEERNLVEAFKKAAEQPFELRVKGMKIYDSHTSKMFKINFEDDYVSVGNKKYPYNLVRIINK